MNGEQRKKSFFAAVCNYFVFFSLVAFVITCSTMLFVTVLSNELGITLTSENIGSAAKLTFWNAALLSLLFTVIDRIRRELTVKRPVKKIIEAAEKMISGDFDVRIDPIVKFGTDDKFNEIIDCINKMAQELSGVETLRTDFIANVSHEMKTPLAVIRNYGTLLASSEISDEKRIEYAKAVTDASKRLSDMVTNVLKLNRLENQQIYPKADTYDLGEQLCECLLQYESVWEGRNIEIETDISEDVTICADSELLSLVWNNLLSNAFKFTNDGGKVSLSLYADRDSAVVKVTDTGCGISSEVGAHIFEKFYQGDASHATQGNGLGLALVKRVVDILRGEIEVISEVGVGTTFCVRLRRNTDEL